MSLPKRYNPRTREPEMQKRWLEDGTYHFEPAGDRPVYGIDTPPPTVSGHLHLGHTYSYSHTDFMARFWRMMGYDVYYPMGFDDNGLPTERLVERWEGVRAGEIGREAFIERCLAVGDEAEKTYKALWQRLGLSIDWRQTYRTIGREARRISQWSFLDLYRQGLAYRKQAPTIWCPTCHTAIAQAEVDDLERESVFYTLAFTLENGETLPIATTRPEMLPACVAIFIHPEDPRTADLRGRTATVPLFGQEVPVLADPAADPEKGTGIVMCCTFGDTTDVEWWYTHELPLVEAIGPEGQMLAPAGEYAGLPVVSARRQIVTALAEEGLLLESEPTAQTVRTHERCDTPVEYMVNEQWFIRILDHKEEFLKAGERIRWHPGHMQARYHQWVENLNWDWCISRQRTFGVTFPLWYCDGCGAIILADEEALPVDPAGSDPPHPCPACGGASFTPETDVMDTWATSSMSPQIAAHLDLAQLRQLGDEKESGTETFDLFPYSLRPQAHEIIRTWAFYTIVKSHYHFGMLPWQEVAISGWGLAPEGSGKISKSRGGGPMAPQEMIEQYSADAVRYWAASTGFGKDSVIDEQKVQAGSKLITKLWNVARFSSRFFDPEMLHGTETALSGHPPEAPQAGLPGTLTPADRWLLARTHRLIERVTHLFHDYEYATAKSEIESYFWQMADNYLEMAKKRLYDGGAEATGAQLALSQMVIASLKLLAPFMPYVTEAIYQGLLETENSIHRSAWPVADERLLDEEAERAGDLLVEIATAVRRYKSESGLSLGSELARLHLATAERSLATLLAQAEPDLVSVTRARQITVGDRPEPGLEEIANGDGLIALSLAR